MINQFHHISRTTESTVQPLLKVNKPFDKYEQEADTMADRVVNSSAGNLSSLSSTGIIGKSVQRKCAHCEEEEKRGKLMRKSEGGGTPPVSPSFVHTLHSAQGGGSVMNREAQHSMEGAFGADFSSVRIHRDSTANQLARSVSALAFTYGNDIYFKDGAYSETSTEGKRLLAHELTHVLQQGNSVNGLIQRDEDTESKKDRSDLSRALDKNDAFQQLPKFARDKILDEIDKAPETITNAVLGQIIDALAPEEYKEGLKKAGESLIKQLFGNRPVTASVCTGYPGYHEGTSSTYRGQCCSSNIESAQSCCPKERMAPNESSNFCCKPGDAVGADGKCFTPEAIDLSGLCLPPQTLVNGICTLPLPNIPPAPKPAEPFSLSFSLGVIDDYDINRSTINSRQREKFDTILQQIHGFMETCPASIVYITGHTDKPGTDSNNFDLGLDRAEYAKRQLLLELIDVHFAGMGPTVFAFSEGESKPVEETEENVYSAKNRRIEFEFHSICPPLEIPSKNTPTYNFFE